MNCTVKAADEAGLQTHLTILLIHLIVDLAMKLQEFYYIVKKRPQCSALKEACSPLPRVLVHTEVA